MQIQKRDGKVARQILTAMIVDQTVLSHIAAVWDKQLFKSQWCNLVGEWCVSYFQKYGKPPGKAIESRFEAWSSKRRDEDTTKIVERFLSGLSDEYESYAREINAQYIIDQAAEHFNEVRAKRLVEEVSDDLEEGNGLKALERIAKFGHVSVGTVNGIDVLRDQEAMRMAFEHESEILIEYPGALGGFFADAFSRDSFISFMGPEKRGKTWWLIDVAWRAMLQRRRVAFFSVGDMSQGQMMRRFQARAAKRPLRAKVVKYPREINHEPGAPFAIVEQMDKEFDKALSWQEGNAAFERVISKTKTKSTLLRLACYPNSSVNVAGLSSILTVWENSGWVPDVIVIDYADILQNPAGYTESRDATNATWKHLRRLSQERHCCVVTATQANAASYRAQTIDMANFSEDKRKLAHVTGMIGINSSVEEKAVGLQRLNWIVLRESEFNTERCIHVAGCFDVGNPAVHSIF